MKPKTFKALGVIEPILAALKKQNITTPTEIQEKTIPLILKGKDIIGGSKTGSGKTLAFSCGIIKQEIHSVGIKSLILVPTRELAEQVGLALNRFSKFEKISIVKVYGGVSIEKQIRNLTSADVVVATPGRLLDHINRNTIRLDKVNVLVLDEADMMLDMGFLRDVEKIIRAIPKKRQTLLFSATVSSEVEHIANQHMNHPIEVSVEQFVDSSKLEQSYIDVSSKEKFSLLVHLLKQETSGVVMVFCNTRRNTDLIAKNLKENGVQSCAIHGGLTQNKRKQILDDFHKGRTYALICTDVAARGLDIKGVSHVYNYDVCKEAKQYVHRIGRTARAGKDGQAITLLSERDHENFSKVMAVNDNIEHEERPHFKQAEMPIKSSRRGGGRPHQSQGRRNPNPSNSRRPQSNRPRRSNNANSRNRRKRT
jgi:ATP-dependent RNA helicase DeaD